MNLYDDAIVAVSWVSSPLAHAYLRMAGTRGAGVVLHCVQQGGVPLYVWDHTTPNRGSGEDDTPDLLMRYIPVGDSPSIDLTDVPSQRVILRQPTYTSHNRQLHDAAINDRYILVLDPTVDVKAAVVLMSRLSPIAVTLHASVSSLLPNVIPHVFPSAQHVHKSPITEFVLLPTSRITQTTLHKFLNGFNHLHTMELLASLSTITHLEGGFLQRCSSLATINLSPFSNVTSVGSNFMEGCSELMSIDLLPLDKVEVIGSKFLFCCVSLKTILLPPCFHKVTHIGNSFVAGCSQLENIDLGGLSNVTAVGSEFLGDCVSLSSVDLGPLHRVSSVGESFLKGCYGLSTLNLQPLHNLTQIPDFFLLECKGLSVLDLSPLANVRTIHSGFLAKCSGLRELDLSPLAGLRSLDGGFFLEGCTGIKSVDLKIMRNIPLEDWDFKCTQFPMFDVDQSVSIYVRPV